MNDLTYEDCSCLDFSNYIFSKIKAAARNDRTAAFIVILEENLPKPNFYRIIQRACVR